MISEEAKYESFLIKFESPQHLKDWVFIFFGIDLPIGHIDPDSNSSPVEWMYDAYSTYRDNKGNEIPGFVVLSSRDSYKTLTESMLAVILMVHFGCTIAHLAAIESQASKAIQYVTSFIQKIKPYAERYSLNIDSQSKRKVALQDSKGGMAYVNVIIATLQGANSEHTNILSIDEVDVMRFPQAYEEAKYIPAVYHGQFPLTIKTSTRKFAFGLMEKEWNGAEAAGEKKLRWNILDVTEHCSSKRNLRHEGTLIRYIHPDLPLQNLSLNEVEILPKEKQQEFKAIEAYKGCATCALLPICQMRLANRPESDIGGLYKPIDHTINQFKKTSPDSATAQLLCRRPSSAGLIYSKFNDSVDHIDGNVYSIQKAFEVYTGEPADPKMELNELIKLLKDKGLKFYAGVDWGFRHFFAITVSAKVGYEWWLIDCYAVSGLEFHQVVSLAEEVRDIYKPALWFADTSQPAFIKTFNRNKMPCKKFKKDVMEGISATREQIVDSLNKRSIKVIKHNRTEFLINGFKHHHFVLDASGNPTQEPDDEEYADVMDTIRYQAQNLFPPKAKKSAEAIPVIPLDKGNQNGNHSDWMTLKTRQMQTTTETVVKSEAGTIIVDFGGDD